VRLWRRAHYVVIIRGLESGNVTRLPFLTFTTEGEARVWVERMNAEKGAWDPAPPLTEYAYEVIDE
jgi:hypothetical protein